MTNAANPADAGVPGSVQHAELTAASLDVPASSRSQQSTTSDMSYVARGGTLNLVGAVFSGIFTFAFYVFLARGLDPASVGAFMVATAISMMVATSCQLGAHVGFVRFIPRFRVLDRNDDIWPIIAIGLIPVLVVGVSAAVVVYASSGWLAGQMAAGEDELLLRRDLQAFAPFIPVISLFTVVIGATQGFATMRPSVLVDKIGRTGLQVLGGLIALVVGGSMAFVSAWGLPYLIGLLIAGYWLVRIASKLASRARRRQRTSDPARLAGEFWGFSGPRGVASVFQVVILWLDTVLIAVLASTEQAGIYAVAMRYLVIGTLGITALLQVLGPKISELLARRDISTLRAVYQGSVAWLMIIVWPLYLSIAICTEPLLSLFGERYVTAGPALALVAATMLLATACGPVDIVLLMAGHSWYSVGNWVAALITFVSLDLWLIPDLGLMGAAIGWSASILVRNLAALVEVLVILKLHPFGGAFRRAALLAVLCFGVVLGGTRLVLGSAVLTLAAGTVLGTGLYLVLLVRSRQVLQLDVFVSALSAAAGRRAGRYRKAAI